jgi:hypothetical protein
MGNQLNISHMNSLWTSGRTSLGIGWTALVVGVWLVISPFALGFSHQLAGLSNNIAVGLALILVTLVSTRNGMLRIFTVLLGIWLAISAFSLPVTEGHYLWNNLLLAFLTIITTVASERPYPTDQRPSR